MSNSQIVVIALADLKTRTEALTPALEAIQARLADGVSAGPANAQAARLVGYALAKQSGEIVQQLVQSVQFLSAPAPEPAAEGAEPAEKKDVMESILDVAGTIALDGSNATEVVAKLASLAAEVVEMIADQFGVEKEAIPAMVYQTSSVFLPIAEDLLAKAKAQFDIADALTAAATQS